MVFLGMRPIGVHFGNDCMGVGSHFEYQVKRNTKVLDFVDFWKGDGVELAADVG